MELLKLAEAALAKREGKETFSIGNVETKVTKTGNVGFRATTDSGKVVTFWKSNMVDVVKEVEGEAGKYEVIAGTQITEDGSLIAASSASKGFWD